MCPEGRPVSALREGSEWGYPVGALAPRLNPKTMHRAASNRGTGNAQHTKSSDPAHSRRRGGPASSGDAGRRSVFVH